jgi:hypothetical protein
MKIILVNDTLTLVVIRIFNICILELISLNILREFRMSDWIEYPQVDLHVYLNPLRELGMSDLIMTLIAKCSLVSHSMKPAVHCRKDKRRDTGVSQALDNREDRSQVYTVQSPAYSEK